jgi:hypothetical protein
MVALLVQKTGGPVGNVNPTLYELASAAPGAFHDITSGNNIVPCTVGTLNCTTGTFGYSAGTGYDLASGLGSIDAANLVQNWPDFQMVLSQTAATLAAGASQQITASITRTATYSNPVSFTCATSTSFLSCSVSGSVSSSGNASLTISRTSSESSWLTPYVNNTRFLFGGYALLAMASVLLFKRKRRLLWGGVAFAALVLAGCGGGGSAANTAQTITPVPTSATVTLTATSGALPLTSTINVTLD